MITAFPRLTRYEGHWHIQKADIQQITAEQTVLLFYLTFRSIFKPAGPDGFFYSGR